MYYKSQQKPDEPNLKFFKGEKRSSGGLKIEDMLEQDGNFDFLEYDHSYIQWLIPNYFSSQFNYDSYALTIEEAIKLKADDQAYSNYKKGLFVYLKFIGIERLDEWLTLINQKALYLALWKNTHNRLRLRRVLASMLAFREIDLSIQLCEILRDYDEQKKLWPTFRLYYFVQENAYFQASMVLPRDSQFHIGSNQYDQFRSMDQYYQYFEGKVLALKIYNQDKTIYSNLIKTKGESDPTLKTTSQENPEQEQKRHSKMDEEKKDDDPNQMQIEQPVSQINIPGQSNGEYIEYPAQVSEKNDQETIVSSQSSLVSLVDQKESTDKCQTISYQLLDDQNEQTLIVQTIPQQDDHQQPSGPIGLQSPVDQNEQTSIVQTIPQQDDPQKPPEPIVDQPQAEQTQQNQNIET